MARGAVNTSTPLWKQPKLLLSIAGVGFVVQAVASFVVGWAGPAALDQATSITFGNTTYTSLSADSAIGSLVTMLVWAIFIAGALGVTTMIMGKTRGPAWGLAYCFGTVLLGLGLGAFISYSRLGRFQPVALGMAVLGFLVCSMHPLAEIRHAHFVRSQAHTKAIGVTTTAKVAKVDIATYDNVHYWVIWLQYDDENGKTFHIKHRKLMSVLDRPTPGQLFSIKYDPAHPGRRSSVVVGSSVGSGWSSGSGGKRGARSSEFVHWKGWQKR
jgi:uncharacterized membrane protein YgcG